MVTRIRIFPIHRHDTSVCSIIITTAMKNAQWETASATPLQSISNFYFWLFFSYSFTNDLVPENLTNSPMPFWILKGLNCLIATLRIKIEQALNQWHVDCINRPCEVVASTIWISMYLCLKHKISGGWWHMDWKWQWPCSEHEPHKIHYFWYISMKLSHEK